MFELIEKKSRFLGYCARVESEAEAKAFIAELAREHKRANHVAFAYVLPTTAKYNDDGEPRGTAGMPLLNAIMRRELVGVVVVVVRYFGGIPLGKGGLIRAYGKTAGKSLDEILEIGD